jgi:hypothetical protein
VRNVAKCVSKFEGDLGKIAENVGGGEKEERTEREGGNIVFLVYRSSKRRSYESLNAQHP